MRRGQEWVGGVWRWGGGGEGARGARGGRRPTSSSGAERTYVRPFGRQNVGDVYADGGRPTLWHGDQPRRRGSGRQAPPRPSAILSNRTRRAVRPRPALRCGAGTGGGQNQHPPTDLTAPLAWCLEFCRDRRNGAGAVSPDGKTRHVSPLTFRRHRAGPRPTAHTTTHPSFL